MSALLAGLLSFTAFALLHMALLRLGDALRRISAIFALAMAVHVAGTVAAALLLQQPNYWSGAGVYWFLLMFWVYAYGTAYKSLSVRMLVRVARQAPVTAASLLGDTGEGDFAARMDSLREMGLARESGGLWRLTPAGTQSAARLKAVQRALNVRAGSMYQWDET